MPAGYDAEVAELFRDLRAAIALSEMDLAARIGTRPEVVQALEQGALYALPPWAETCRVVNAYGTLLNLDVRPLLRRIYAQLEAGIVELQPKPFPDVPMMTPSDSGDFGFAPDASASGAPNPLDIQWPPAPQSPPRKPWPNAGPASPSQAQRPNPAPPPQPQKARPQTQGGQYQQQAWPGAQPLPQAARPNIAAPRSAPPQTPPDRRAPQPRAPQAKTPQPPPQRVAPRSAGPSESELLEATFGAAAAPPAPEPAKRGRWAGLVKWGIVALVAAVVAFALWFALRNAPGSSGLQSPGPATVDPDDPRSKKTDRLPQPQPQPQPEPQPPPANLPPQTDFAPPPN